MSNIKSSQTIKIEKIQAKLKKLNEKLQKRTKIKSAFTNEYMADIVLMSENKKYGMRIINNKNGLTFTTLENAYKKLKKMNKTLENQKIIYD